MVVAVDSDIDHSYEIKDLQHSLRSANLEINLAHSKHSVEVVAKNEEIRKLQVSQCLLESDNSDLHEQLEEEQARSDELESALDEALLNLDEQKAEGEAAQKQIRTQSREIANLKAELKAMENVTSDSNKILSEKLALSREISSLRPEVEHLRAQVESNQGLLSEKLSLQRQFATLQVELENEKRTSARTISKQGKKMEQDEALRNELEELRRELATEKQDRAHAEAAAADAKKAVEKIESDLESQQRTTEKLEAKLEKLAKKDTKASKRDEVNEAALEQVREELEQERTLRVKAEKALQKAATNTEVEQLREELELEKQARQKAEKALKKSSSQQTNQADDAQKELEEERRERKKQEKEYTKTLAELQGRNTVLDDKLNAFRDKLRTTKEKLKEKEAQLERVERAQTAPPSKTATEATKVVKNIRKRTAASVEPETHLGTPGDAPTKRFKRGTSVSAVGDTSNFSLTPFLNRTTITAGSPILEEDEEEDASTSTAPIKAPQLKASRPLAPTASVKANPKPRKKTALSSVLAAVDEETPEPTKDTSAHAPTKVPLKDADDDSTVPTLKAKKPSSKSKPRKSLMSFANFTEEPTAEKKKKRRLGAVAGKTLFDADEDEEGSQAKPAGFGMGGGKGLFAARALGKHALGKGSRPISGGFGMMSEEAFTFSPLKKDRRRAGDSILK